MNETRNCLNCKNSNGEHHTCKCGFWVPWFLPKMINQSNKCEKFEWVAWLKK